MAQTTIEQFATELKMPSGALLEQLAKAGVAGKRAGDKLSETDKTRLLEYLRKSHGGQEQKKKITLTRKQTSEIKAADSTGRARTIQVEVRKRRVFVKRDGAEAAPAVEETAPAQPVVSAAEAAAREEEARKAAALIAKQQEEVQAKQEQAKKRKTKKEKEAEEAAAKAAAEAVTAAKAAEGAAQQPVAEAKPAAAKTEGTLHKPAAKPGAKKEKGARKPSATAFQEEAARRRALKLRGGDAGATATTAWKQPKTGRHRHEEGEELGEGVQAAAPEPIIREISVPETITIADLARKMSVKAAEVIKAAMKLGTMVTINQVVDQETAMILIEEMGHKALAAKLTDPDALLAETAQPSTAEVLPRPPVVTVMGHVDHGKTSLLDYIRRTRVASGEAGGITQHIGAYHVETPKGVITFLDTPGHEAFTAMRARGAKVTDIVVLVVAADDGVMPQTIEAIDHARAAKAPIVVAINKIDKANANVDRVKKELADQGVLLEAWGGDTPSAEISALNKQGIDHLLELILLVADMQELSAPAVGEARGVVLEARREAGRGNVATVLVQAGTLRVGDVFFAGSVFGRVRSMQDDRGEKVSEAAPATPVEVTGFEDLPQAGDPFQVVEDEAKARTVVSFRQQKDREKAMASSSRLSLEQLFNKIQEGKIKDLPIILKADVAGSVEVLSQSLKGLSNEKVKISLLHSGVGAININDVLLASASGAIIVGFNVRPEKKAAEEAEKAGVDIRLHTVIYNVTDEIKKAMEGLLDPTLKEVARGRAEVRNTFKVPKFGVVAGCYVTEGTIPRSSQLRLLRDNRVIYEGKVGSLRRFKDDVSEVKQGFECGIGLDKYQDVKVGDIIEAFQVEKVAGVMA
ncbi:MAG TPA: translation initiation factor IF-2 [Casimicrobiaceae bacterium]|nr:translation initiation factor IF-2 [Casimicrobiaceae bacterium]